jgi:hypothetical protein
VTRPAAEREEPVTTTRTGLEAAVQQVGDLLDARVLSLDLVPAQPGRQTTDPDDTTGWAVVSLWVHTDDRGGPLHSIHRGRTAGDALAAMLAHLGGDQ